MDKLVTTNIQAKEPAESSALQRMRKLAELSLNLAGNPANVFRQVASMIGELMDVRVVCLSEIRGEELYFISVYVDGEVMLDAGHCPLNITPCATVQDSKDMRIYDKVIEKFPQASFLKQHNAYSYCGFPALDSNGKVIAVTCLLDDKEHDFSEEDQYLLRVFGQRIAAEIENKRHQEEKQLAYDKLREREKHYRHLVETASAMPWSYNLKTSRFEYMGPQAEKILGYPVEEWYQENFWPEHMHPDDRDWALRYCMTETKMNRDHEFEYRMLAKDGRVVWIRDSVNVIHGANGPEQLQGFMFDISERKNVEDALNIIAEVDANADIKQFFHLCVMTLARVYDCQYAFIGLVTDTTIERVETQSVWAAGHFVDNFT